MAIDGTELRRVADELEIRALVARYADAVTDNAGQAWIETWTEDGRWTIGGTTNDVGIITLPFDAGHIVAAVFVKQSEADVEDRELVIAHIARAVHDYFLFNPGSR